MNAVKKGELHSPPSNHEIMFMELYGIYLKQLILYLFLYLSNFITASFPFTAFLGMGNAILNTANFS